MSSGGKSHRLHSTERAGGKINKMGYMISIHTLVGCGTATTFTLKCASTPSRTSWDARTPPLLATNTSPTRQRSWNGVFHTIASNGIVTILYSGGHFPCATPIWQYRKRIGKKQSQLDFAVVDSNLQEIRLWFDTDDGSQEYGDELRQPQSTGCGRKASTISAVQA